MSDCGLISSRNADESVSTIPPILGFKWRSVMNEAKSNLQHRQPIGARGKKIYQGGIYNLRKTLFIVMFTLLAQSIVLRTFFATIPLRFQNVMNEEGRKLDVTGGWRYDIFIIHTNLFINNRIFHDTYIMSHL
jgi:hypothetical protein